MNFYNTILEYSLYSIPLGRIALFLLGVTLSITLRTIIRSLLRKPLKKTRNFATILLDGLSNPIAFLVVFLGFYFSLIVLDIHSTVNLVALNILQLLLTFTVL